MPNTKKRNKGLPLYQRPKPDIPPHDTTQVPLSENSAFDYEKFTHNDSQAVFYDRRAWERQPKENEVAFEEFTLFLNMPDRTIVKLAKRLGKSVKNMQVKQTRYKWLERIRMYDDEQMRQAEIGARRAAQERGKLWAERKLEVKDKCYEIGLKLAERTMLLLNLPTADIERKGEPIEAKDGRIIYPTTILNFKENPRDAARYADVGIKLLQLSTGQATENIGFSDVDIDSVDIDSMTLDELDAYAAKIETSIQKSVAAKAAETKP